MNLTWGRVGTNRLGLRLTADLATAVSYGLTALAGHGCHLLSCGYFSRPWERLSNGSLSPFAWTHTLLRRLNHSANVPEQMPKNASRGRAASKRPAKSRARPKSVRDPLQRLRSICLGLPQSTEVEAWGAPTFRVGKLFAMYASPSSQHSGGRPAVWIYSVSVEQDLVIRSRPEKYFKPAYVGAYGWIGAWLDQNPAWDEIEELLRDAWRRRAPKKVAALLAP